MRLQRFLIAGDADRAFRGERPTLQRLAGPGPTSNVTSFTATTLPYQRETAPSVS